MDSKEELPNYFYRDDGLKVWEAIKRSVATCFCGDGVEKSVTSLLNIFLYL